MPRFDGKTEFIKAAIARLRDAEELLELPTKEVRGSEPGTRHLVGSVYLSGYAVECMLKAYLINQNRHRRLSTLNEDMRRRDTEAPNLLGAEGHSVSRLLSLSDLELALTEDKKRAFGTIASRWSTDMRYSSKVVSREEAHRLVGLGRELYDWILSRI